MKMWVWREFLEILCCILFFFLIERRKKASAWERNLVYPAVMVLLLIETVRIYLPS